jgi:GNAT superfamily N-acetyltransferase
MPFRIVKRNLTEIEISSLTEETKKSIHIGLIKPILWKKFKDIYVFEIDGELAGICAIFFLKKWIKIGPLLVLEKHQGKGVGKALLKKIVAKHPKSNLYIGSSNTKVKKIAICHEFKETEFIHLPFEIKIYLLSYIYNRFGIDYFIDAIKKKTKCKEKYVFYCLRR